MKNPRTIFAALLLVPLAGILTAGVEGQPPRIVVRQRQFIDKAAGRPFEESKRGRS